MPAASQRSELMPVPRHIVTMLKWHNLNQDIYKHLRITGRSLA